MGETIPRDADFECIFWRTPSLAAGRLECGWCETVELKPVGSGDLFYPSNVPGWPIRD